MKMLKTLTAIFLFLSLLVSAQDTKELQGNYSETKTTTESEREKTKENYLKSNSDKKKIKEESSKQIFELLTEKIFPAWYGTTWDFNGKTRIPGEGTIACGSFVVFTLQDVGFKVPTKMLQQPSENIIKNLTTEKFIKRFSNRAKIDKIEKWIRSKGEGLFIVGLDIHVGFIIYKNDKITFCHSSYYNPPFKVVNQDLREFSPFTESNYRVVGKILTDKMMKKWILEKKFEIEFDYFKNR